VLAFASLPEPKNPNEANANAIVSVFFISPSLLENNFAGIPSKFDAFSVR
jgi:hypothetical protein